jgi:hypothetical protein
MDLIEMDLIEKVIETGQRLHFAKDGEIFRVNVFSKEPWEVDATGREFKHQSLYAALTAAYNYAMTLKS